MRLAFCGHTAFVGFLVLAVSCPALGHSDDPKIRDLQPPYRGPGYRAGQESQPLVTFESSGVTLLSWLPLQEFGNPANGNDCWGYTSPSGREYAIMCVANATGFVEVTDPANAQVVKVIPGPNSLWRDAKVYQDHAYIVTEGGGGIQVVDMSQIDAGVVTLVNTVDDVGPGSTHNVAINTDSGFLYRCGGGENVGLRIYDLSDKANPQHIATWNSRYVHDAQIVSYTDGPYAGREIAFLCSGFGNGSIQTGLEVLDVTDKQAIVSLTRVFWQQAAYSHQGWLSPDRKYFYMGDELDEGEFGLDTTTHIFDVSVIETPVYVGKFATNVPATGHNMYTKDNLLYQANYRSGVRIFDATDPVAPVEIAWFDTYPGSNSNNFNGLWSVFPYFPSGTIIGSDMQRGLFVWRMGQPGANFIYPNGLPEFVAPQGQTIEVQIGVPGIITPDIAPPVMYYQSGAQSGVLTLSEPTPDLFVATFPALQCGDTVSYYFEVQTPDGAIWRDPPGAPANRYETFVTLDLLIPVFDTLENGPGQWTVGASGDTATAGIWAYGDPLGTSAQPSTDHTPAPGVNCWFTGQGSQGGGTGEADVDGGRTTLTSPSIPVAGLSSETYLSYWRWYSNDEGSAPQSDIFEVQISADAGQTWLPLETVGPTGQQASGGWFQFQSRVFDVVPAAQSVQLRFVASDLGSSSIVEAAVDDVELRSFVCVTSCPADLDGNGAVDQLDLNLLLSEYGCANRTPPCSADLDGNGAVDQLDLNLLLAQYGQSCQ